MEVFPYIGTISFLVEATPFTGDCSSELKPFLLSGVIPFSENRFV